MPALSKLLPLLAGSLVGLAAGWFLRAHHTAAQLDHTIAMSWGDGPYGRAFYGAHVYLVPLDDGYSVHARVYIGRGNDYFHDMGELGRAATDEEAVARWGEVQWKPEVLQIGTGADSHTLERAVLENHR